ncbi:MAG TPA: mandelate racemase/muconate lactonizing enzyme family protein [Ramlibacter sp.]|nr:mandelate racemase/muconate lactonizing enzyme family protein [Ramlibacter sp.]
MKITAIEPVLCALPLVASDALPVKMGRQADLLLVRVRTDEGLVGWGEVFALGHSWKPALTALQKTVAPRCIGKDPLAIASLSRDVSYAIHQLGRSGSVMLAWSGVEIALWDLLGKSLGVPLHRLFGGAQVQRLEAYASLPRYGQERVVAARTAAALQRGYRSVKLHEVVPACVHAAWSAARDAQAWLMVDVNAEWTPPEAEEALRAMEDIPLRWLEEPLRPTDDYDALARLRASCGVPIAAGEAVSSISDFHTALRANALDWFQPSVSKLGGIGAMRRVMELAADTAVEIAPHTPQFGPAVLASLQLCAALAPTAPMEHFFVDLAASPFGEAVLPRDGWFAVPDGPGLGRDPDPDVLKATALELPP